MLGVVYPCVCLALEERLEGDVRERFGKAGRWLAEANGGGGEVEKVAGVAGDEIKAIKFYFLFNFY